MKQLLWGLCLCTFLSCEQKEEVNQHRFIKTTFEHTSLLGEERPYSIYLPTSYYSDSKKNYPVIYMMDGQALFAEPSPFTGASWNAHLVADSLAARGEMEEVIIVGLDNAEEKRFSEYMPQKPVEMLADSMKDTLLHRIEYPIYSDDFLQFLVERLKPRIDSSYRTLPASKHTYVGGSSMGGLISMYALCEYPQVFGGALCLSSHWIVGYDDSTPQISNLLTQYFEEHVPDGKRWYFDYGTKGLDQYYEPYQLIVDSILLEKGYQKGDNWITKKFEGHDHREQDWNQRLPIPFNFAFGKE